MDNCGSNERFRAVNGTETNMAATWSKSFVELELPDESVLHREGISLSLEMARLVALLWSRVFWHGDSRSRDSGYNGCFLLERVVTVRVPDGLGGNLPPLLAASGVRPQVPTGATALKQIGIESVAISQLRADSPTFATSCLPLPVLLAGLPAPAWAYVAALISCDPDRDLLPRVHEALREYGRSVGDARLGTCVQGLWLFLRHLCDLRRELAAEQTARTAEGREPLVMAGEVERWVVVPRRPTKPELAAYGQGGTRQDRSAVPLSALSTALKRAVRDAGWGRWEPSEWSLNRSWLALKRLAVMCVLCTVCPRVTHLVLLDVDDFAPDHVFEDGSCGPGVRFRRSLMKGGGSRTDAYWKRVPDFVGAVLTAWIICSGRSIGQADAPLFITRKVTSPGEQGRRYSSNVTMRMFITGTAQPGSQRLIPWLAHARGYTPHRFRNMMTQLVERLFAAWKVENPGHHLASYSPHDVAEIAVDHKVSDLGYRDYKSRKRVEELLALAIELVWNEVWGDGLQPRGLDPEAIGKAHDAVVLIEAELQLLDQQLHELEAQDIAALKGSQTAAGEDAQLKALLASQTLNGEIRMKLRRQMKLKDDLIAVRAARERAMTVPVVLPADLDGADHERRLAEVLARVNGRERPTLIASEPLADELTTSDIADLYQVNGVHVRRWRRGEHNPPLDHSQWLKYSEKDWRYPVAAIDGRARARIPAADPQAALETVRRNRAAVGYGKARAKAPREAALEATDAMEADRSPERPVVPPEAVVRGDDRDDGDAATAITESPPTTTRRRCVRTGVPAQVRDVLREQKGKTWTISGVLDELTPLHPETDPSRLRRAIGAVLAGLAHSGELERRGTGTYSVREIATPLQGRPPQITATLRDIMRAYPDQIWTPADLFDELSPSRPDDDPARLQESINGALARLTRIGELEREGQGRYRTKALADATTTTRGQPTLVEAGH
jgi:hypothetical protein